MTNDGLQDLAEQLCDLASEVSVDLEGTAELPADLRDKLALALTGALKTLEPLGEVLHE